MTPDLSHAAFEALPTQVQRALVGAVLSGARGWVGCGVAHVLLLKAWPEDPLGALRDVLVDAGYSEGWLHKGEAPVAQHWVWFVDGVRRAPKEGVGYELQPWSLSNDACVLLRRRARVDPHKGVLAACLCARDVLSYIPASERRPLHAIEIAEAWARGKASLTQVRHACRDSRRAYIDAAYADYQAHPNRRHFGSHETYSAGIAPYVSAYAGVLAVLHATHKGASPGSRITVDDAAASAADARSIDGFDRHHLDLRRVELARLADRIRLHIPDPGGP